MMISQDPETVRYHTAYDSDRARACSAGTRAGSDTTRDWQNHGRARAAVTRTRLKLELSQVSPLFRVAFYAAGRVHWHS